MERRVLTTVVRLELCHPAWKSCRCAVCADVLSNPIWIFFKSTMNFDIFTIPIADGFWWLLRFLQLLLTQSNPSPGAVCIELCPKKLLCIGVIDIATLIFSEL